MLLVVGATGELGSRVTRRLLSQGKSPVRVLVRQSSNYDDFKKAGAEIVFGDLKQPDTLQKACEGAQRVLTTASASVRGGADTIEAVDRHGTRALIDAARKAKVEQFIFVSAHGFDPDAPIPLARYKGENEAHLRQSGMNYTILRPANFMEAWIGFVIGGQLQNRPSVTIVGDGQTKHHFVSIENVADLAAAVVGHPQAQNVSLPLASPEAISYRDIIKMIEQTTGQSINIESVEAGESLPGLPEIIAELWAWMVKTGESDLDIGDVARTYNLQMISVQDFVRQAFGRPRAA